MSDSSEKLLQASGDSSSNSHHRKQSSHHSQDTDHSATGMAGSLNNSNSASNSNINSNNSSNQSLLNNKETQPENPSNSNFPDPKTCDFITATQHGFEDRCLQLLESNQVKAGDTDDENICPLHWAAINNRINLMKIFISYGAVIDQVGGELGGTPLHWAVRQSCFAACKILLDAGADPAIMDAEGYTTFHIAAQLGSWPILSLILCYNNGEYIDIKDNEGRTPIMMALIGRQMETLRVLCALGCKLNAQDKNLNSVLHYAVKVDFAGGINVILTFMLKHTHGLYKNGKQNGGLYLLPPLIGLRKIHENMQLRNSLKLTPLGYSRSEKNLHCTRVLERFENMIPEEIVGRKPIENRVLKSQHASTNNNSYNHSNSKIRQSLNSLSEKLSSLPFAFFRLIEVILYRIFGNFSAKQRAIISYFLPSFVVISVVTILSCSFEFWPYKVIFGGFLYMAVHYISNFITTVDSNRFIPVGIICAMKIYGMPIGLLKFSPNMSLTWCVAWFISCPFTWYCLYRCSFGNPGTVEPFYEKHDKIAAWLDLKKNLISVYEEQNGNKNSGNEEIRLCTSSMIRKPLRSKHCSEGMLDHSIGRFDHYCPWVVNAIGYRNHHWFMSGVVRFSFLIFLAFLVFIITRELIQKTLYQISGYLLFFYIQTFFAGSGH